jgi:hypothetical protein
MIGFTPLIDDAISCRWNRKMSSILRHWASALGETNPETHRYDHFIERDYGNWMKLADDDLPFIVKIC